MCSNSLKKIITSSLALSLFLITGSIIQTPKNVQAREEIYINTNSNGNLTIIPDIYTYRGDEVVAIPIPDGLKIKDVEIISNGSEYDIYDDLDEEIINNHILISGLTSGVNYENLSIKLEGLDDIDYFYSVEPFVFVSTQPQNSSFTNPSNPHEKQTRKRIIQTYLSNVYKNIFNRDIDPQGSEYWSERLVTDSIRLRNFFKNLLTEDEFKKVAPTVEDKIKKLYLGIFQRHPDQNGFIYWVGRYNQELSFGNSETDALRKVIDNMTSSGEFKGVLGKLRLNY